MLCNLLATPDLTSGQLYTLLANLKNQGIQKINGDLVLDTSVFASHDRGLGWIWNDLTMCFNSPPAAANIDNNCFYAELDANQPVGETVKLTFLHNSRFKFSDKYILQINKKPVIAS